MRTSETVNSATVELLSRITGKNLDARDITPPVLFLAALITVLLGVMYADRKVTEEEKQRWSKTLKHFVPEEGTVRQLALLLSKGIREQQLYTNSDETLTLLMPFSESERLLLIGLGYEMSSADGAIAEVEQHFLRQIASLANLKSSYLEVLEAGFTQQSVADVALLEEVRSLLDPARFHELDTLFVKAASDLLALLPMALPAAEQKPQPSQIAVYDRLNAFQTCRMELDDLCNQFYQISQFCCDRNLLSHTFGEDVAKLSRKLQSQRFRVAVVGEFSQGKSTLLNALLGEEIQPVRAIPCSGTVTRLCHGSRKQVICRYEDGRQEEISVDQYKEKASIPKAAAAGHYSDELATSDLEEIIFEHPDLELCKSGVEIVDSPGLNEHPDRTAITEKLLKDTDAALFLTNAARLLPEREKELMQAVRSQLSGDGGKSPAQNLFVLVNFMDLLDSDDDRQDVRERLEGFIAAESLVVPDKNRVHYISAKAALKKQDGYLQSFREFTQAIEQFLTVERGSVQIQGVAKQLTTLIQRALLELNEFETADIQRSEAERQQILEQIGEASGRDVKIQIVADQMIEEAIEQAIQSFETWNEGLSERIIAASKSWQSEHSQIWDQKRLTADYANQFNAAVKQELDRWASEELKTKILSPALETLRTTIRGELDALQHNSTNFYGEINTRFSNQLNLIIDGIDDGIWGVGGFLGGGAAGIAVAAGLWAIPVVIAFAPIVTAAATVFVIGSFALGHIDVDRNRDKIKAEVMTKGFEQFDQSLEAICGQIRETIASVFQSRLDLADEAIRQIIDCYEYSLQVREQTGRSGIDPWLAQQQQALQHLQQQVEAVVARSSI